MIKNRELALIPDSALELLAPPTASPTRDATPSTGTRSRDATSTHRRRPPRRPSRPR